MKSFLGLIAETYYKYEKDKLYKYCFIFPNRRSGVFFQKYLSETATSALILPEITTITDFINSVTSSNEASRIELLFTLYEEYRKLSDEVADFDQFVFWGDMIINDFNDVDKYLADAKQLFTNVREIKEINSSYFTDDQINIINEYWGESRPLESIEVFWKHIHNPTSETDNKKKFLKLWEILYPLYSNLKKNLEKRGLSYSGMAYRKAAAIIKDKAAVDMDFTRYIFVGFNVLSTSEEKIFNYLKEKGIADFYWDFNSPAFKDKFNKAGRFLNRYISEFKSLYRIDADDITEFPNIEVISIPSEIGQAKYAGQIVKNLLSENKIKDKSNAINTAIVLPDEELFMPMLHSIPDEIDAVNITMGYPMKYTSVAALVNAISAMHIKARKIKEEFQYYHEDVKTILAIPFIREMAGKDYYTILEYIQSNKAFFVPGSFLTGISPELAILFMPVNDPDNTGEVITYLRNILRIIENHIMNSNKSEADNIELGFIAQYITTLNQFAATIEEHSINMQEKTFFFMIERLLASSSIAFEGEPLKGLQIMGVLETRTLDFENVVILSMNERIFPQKHFSKTFIPNNLRKGFGLATSEFQDSIYSYYFYRLISRAENVYLLYDSRSQGISSGEKSRYIYQLQHLYCGGKIINKSASFRIVPPDEPRINVVKSSQIMEKLNRYRERGSGKSFSASSINTYINCPLQFYFEKVEDIYADDDISEFMDSGTFGTIVHSILQEIYETQLPDKNNEILITEGIIKGVQKNNVLLERLITRTINREFHYKKDDCLDPLTGESYLIGDIVKYYVQLLLEYDKKIAPFIYVCGEKKEEFYWELSPETGFNFKQYIDRVDIINPHSPTEMLRIVDYKTGSDITDIKGVENMFITDKNGFRAKAILQLMLYCNAYSVINGYDKPILPVIYKIRFLKSTNEFCIKIKNESTWRLEKINDYHELNDAFLERLESVISEIFNPEITFSQTDNLKNCTYCKFKDFCRR